MASTSLSWIILLSSWLPPAHQQPRLSRSCHTGIMQVHVQMAFRDSSYRATVIQAAQQLCAQMAARDTGYGAVEQFMHQGKLLALDLLTHVFQDPGHNWSLTRPQACCWPSS